jgi:hypothetical protein
MEEAPPPQPHGHLHHRGVGAHLRLSKLRFLSHPFPYTYLPTYARLWPFPFPADLLEGRTL